MKTESINLAVLSYCLGLLTGIIFGAIAITQNIWWRAFARIVAILGMCLIVLIAKDIEIVKGFHPK